MWTLRTFLRRLIWVCMAPLLLLALVSLTVNLLKSQAQRDADLEQHAQLTRQYFDLRLSSRAQGLRTLAQSPHLADALPSAAAWADFYREALAFQANFGDHVVLAHQGRMLMNTRAAPDAPLPAMPGVSGRSAVSQALASGQAAVGDLFDGPLSQVPLLAMAVPLTDPSRAGQTLLAIMEAAQFERQLRDTSLPEGVSALLLDSTGRPIARRGTIDVAVAAPAPFGKRVVLPLERAPWSLVLEVDGTLQRALFLKDAARWLTALAAAAAAAYLAARLAGRRLETGFKSLTMATAPPAPRQDIAEIAHARALLQRLNQQRDQKEAELRGLLAQIGQAQELERKRIALDLHDDLQQTLASLKMSAAALRRADDEAQRPLRQQLAQSIDQQADQAVQSVRRIVEDLRPQALDGLGLEAALEGLVARFAQETGLQASFDTTVAGGGEAMVDPALSITLYRVAQEALNNVRKHAQAQAVAVQLTQGADGQVVLRVADDGRGLPLPPGAGAGLGLVGMRERMRAVGGTLELRPAEGGGTEVLATAPMGSGPAV